MWRQVGRVEFKAQGFEFRFHANGLGFRVQGFGVLSLGFKECEGWQVEGSGVKPRHMMLRDVVLCVSVSVCVFLGVRIPCYQR